MDKPTITDEITTGLTEFADALKRHDIYAKILGKVKASFLYAKVDERAVEVSIHERQWLVEFWESEDSIHHDEEYPTMNEAVEAVRKWLNEGK